MHLRRTGASRATLFIVVVIVWLSLLTLVALSERPGSAPGGTTVSVSFTRSSPTNISGNTLESITAEPAENSTPSFRVVRVVMTSSYLFLSVINNGSVPISSLFIGIAMIGNATPVIPNNTVFPTVSNRTPLEPGAVAWVNTTFFAPPGSGISDIASGAYYVVIQAQYRGVQSFVQIEVSVKH